MSSYSVLGRKNVFSTVLTAIMVWVIGLTGSAYAAAYTWDNTGGSDPVTDGTGGWNITGGNNVWKSSTPSWVVWPNNLTDTATIGNGGAANTITVGTISCGGITFAAVGSGTYTLSSGTITWNAGGTINASGADATINSTLAGTTVSVSGSGGKAITLGGNNTFTGILTINSGGTVKLGATGTSPNGPLGTTAGNTTVSSGGMLDLNGYTLATAEPLTISGTGISSAGALVNNGAAASYSGAVTINAASTSIGGSGNITLTAALAANANSFNKVGNNTLQLNVASTRTGGTTITSGTVFCNGVSGLGGTSSGGAIALNGGTLSMKSDSAMTFGFNGTTFGGGSLVLDRVTAGSVTYTTYLSLPNGVTANISKGATATSVSLECRGSNGTALNSGTLNIGSGVQVYAPNGIGYSIANGSTINLTGGGTYGTYMNTSATANSSTWNVDGGARLDVDRGQLAGSSGAQILTVNVGNAGTGGELYTGNVSGKFYAYSTGSAANSSMIINLYNTGIISPPATALNVGGAVTVMSSGGTLMRDAGASAGRAGNLSTMYSLSIGSYTLNSGTRNGTWTSVPTIGFSNGTTVTGNPTFNANNADIFLGAVNDGGSARTFTITGNKAVIFGGLSAATMSGAGAGNTFSFAAGTILGSSGKGLTSLASPNAITLDGTVGELRAVYLATSIGQNGNNAFRSADAGAADIPITVNSGGILGFYGPLASSTYGAAMGNVTYNGGTIDLNRNTSGTGLNTIWTINNLNIGSVTLAPTASNFTTAPTFKTYKATLTGDATFDTSNANIWLYEIDDGGVARNITVQGGNTLRVSGLSSYSTAVNTFKVADGATLRVEEGGDLGAANLGSKIWLADTGTLWISNQTGNPYTVEVTQILNGTGGAGVNGIIPIGNGWESTLRINGGLGQDTTISSAIDGYSGVGILEKAGASTLTLDGTGENTLSKLEVYEGEVRLNKTGGASAVWYNLDLFGGTVKCMAANQLFGSYAANLSIAALSDTSANFDLNGNNQTIGNLWTDPGNKGKVIATGGGVLTIASYGGTSLRDGEISAVLASDDTVQMSVIDGTKTTLSGNNTFAGRLVVYNNTLSIPTINNDSADGTLGNSALSVGLGFYESGTPSSVNGTIEYTGTSASSTKKFTLVAGTALNPVRGIFNVTGSGTTLTLTGAIDQDISASGTDADLVKSGAGKLVLGGSSYTYTGATIVSNGTLAVNGDISASSAVDVKSGAILKGSGKVSRITGAGLVSAGNSPGILTATQVDPADGADFVFEFGSTGSPTYGNATASVNDVLRITDGTTPFASNLGSGNVIDVYLNVASLSNGDVFKGGFYTDKGSAFDSSISGATYHFWVLGDGNGTHSGYYTLAEVMPNSSIVVSTVQETADFGGGNVNGYVTKLTLSPLGSVYKIQ